MNLLRRKFEKISCIEGDRPAAGDVRRHESGQSLVELALIVPLLVTLVIGIVEMGRYAYLSIVLGNSARAGAAYGAQGLAYSNDPTGIQTAASNDFKDNGETSGLSVNSFSTCGCDQTGSVSPDDTATCSVKGAQTCSSGGHWVITVHVTASAKFSALFKYPGIPPSLTITDTAAMRVKQD